MTKKKSEIELFDEENIEVAPNVIIIMPIFFLPREPYDKFVVPSISYVRPYTTDFNGPVNDESLLEAIKHTAVMAHEISQRGLMLTDKFYRLRDFDKELPSAILKADGLPDINIIFVEGPHFDNLMLSSGKVSVH